KGGQRDSQIRHPPFARSTETHGAHPRRQRRDAACDPLVCDRQRGSSCQPSPALSAARGTQVVMLDEEILYLPVRELARRIQARTISPVELTRSYLDRSEKLGPKLNAYATLTPELALRQAQAAEREIAEGHYRGPLHGIPYAAKDVLAVKGYPTT